MMIREAKVGDEEDLARVHCAAWQKAYTAFVPQHVIDEWNASRLEKWTKYVNDPNPWAHNLICEEDAAVVGFALFGACRDEGTDKTKHGELYALYFHPDYWRRGFGRAIAARVLERLRDMRFEDVCVWAFESNAPARLFYERIGFQLQPKRAKDLELGGLSFREVCYWQSLARP